MIKDQAKWNEWVEKNTDPYSKACVDVAREVMRMMDEMPEGPLPVTPHDLICKADDAIKAGGLTGFMAGAVASMVSACHSRGEEFRRAWNLDTQIGAEGEAANASGGVLNPAVLVVK